MTPNERLIFQALAVLIKRADQTATAVEAYHDNESGLVLEQIEARLDSQTADEMDWMPRSLEARHHEGDK